MLDLFKHQISFMKKIVTILMLLCLLISCERKDPNFSEEMIEILADRGEIKEGVVRLPPPPTSFTDLYFRIKSNEIVLINSNELFFFYNEYYSEKFKSFKDFLNEVLNEKLVLDERLFRNPNYPQRFKLNSKIEFEYLNLGFDKFLKKYSKETASKRLALNRAVIKEGEYSTIAYFLYINKYDISSDCYLAIDYLSKREDSFK